MPPVFKASQNTHGYFCFDSFDSFDSFFSGVTLPILQGKGGIVIFWWTYILIDPPSNYPNSIVNGAKQTPSSFKPKRLLQQWYV